MERTMVLSADQWEMTDEKTGEIRRGVTLQYINDYREDSARAVGYKPIKAPATIEVFEAIREHGAPGVYDLDFRTRPGAEGKPTLTVVRAAFVREVPVFEDA